MKRKPRVGSNPTPAELRVLELAAQGLTMVRVARRLGLSSQTARTHIRSLHMRLGVHNRASLLRVAMEKGLLPLPLPGGPITHPARRAAAVPGNDHRLTSQTLNRYLGAPALDKPPDGGSAPLAWDEAGATGERRRKPFTSRPQLLGRKRITHAVVPGKLGNARPPSVTRPSVALRPELKFCPHCGHNLEAVTRALA